jgi:hypothetical protein
VGGSLVRANGSTVASYCSGIDSATINLKAQDSFSAKRRRGKVSLSYNFNLSMTIYENLCVGLALIGEDI